MKQNRNTFAMGSILAGLGVVMSGAAWAQNPNASTGSAAERKAAQKNPVLSGKEVSADKQFLMKAIQGNLAEIQMGQLALKQSKSQIVQDLRSAWWTNTPSPTSRPRQLATRKGLDLAKSPDAAAVAMMRRLSKMKTGFDKAYLNHMLMDHKKDVADYAKEAKTGYDDDIKTYATTTLPTLQRHLSEVQNSDQPDKGIHHAPEHAPQPHFASQRHEQQPERRGMPAAAQAAARQEAAASRSRQRHFHFCVTAK